MIFIAPPSFENITVQPTQSDQLTISWTSPKPLSLAPLLQTEEKRELFSFAMKVRAEYLQFALDQIKHTAGGIEAYLEAEFDLDEQRLAALRDHYLTE